MFAYNDNLFVVEAYLKMPEYTEAQRSNTTINHRISEKMNTELNYNFS